MSLRKSSIIEKAQKLVLKGKFQQAIKEWEKLAAETPNDGNINNAIGDIYLKADDKTHATDAFLKAADDFKNAAFELKSIALYKKALKVDPSKIEVYAKLALVYADRGLIGDAIGNYLKAAKYHSEKGDLKGALSVYRNLSELDPKNIKIHIEIAEMCEKEALQKEAIEEYKKILHLYESDEKPAEASKMLEKILTLDPNYRTEIEQVAEASIPETSEETNSEVTSKDPFFIQNEFPEITSTGFMEPESEPMADEQTIINDQSLGSVSPGGTNENTLESALTEVEVYLQYGLNEKAIDALESMTETFPCEAEPHLKLKEIYAQQGLTEKVTDICRTLLTLYNEIGDDKACDTIRSELKKLQPQKEATSFKGDWETTSLEMNAEEEFDLPLEKQASFETPTLQVEGQSLVSAESLSELSQVSFLQADFSKDPLLKEANEVSFSSFEEGLPDNETVKEIDPFTSPQELEPSLPALNLAPERDDYVDLNSILSEDLEEEADEPEALLEKSSQYLPHQGEDKGEEAETQYDLGIAYKEMGMVSEAMGAFKLASQGKSRYEDAMIMLALCYREEGSTSSAISVLEESLSGGGEQAREMIAIKYELALLYEKIGNKKSSELFQEVSEINPLFRDTPKKLQHSKIKESRPLPRINRRDRVSYL